MVITIRGLKHGAANAASVTALLSSMVATVKSKKTFVMQLTGYGEPSVIDFLIGKQLSAEEINLGFKVWRDEGIDAITVRAETADLTKEHYDQTVTAISEKENLFDVLKPTQKKEFFDFVSEESILNIIDGAKDIYDYIFILLPENKEVIDIVAKRAEENIVVIPQGPKVAMENIPEKVTFIVNDFEKNSIYTVRDIAKDYGVKKLYVLPHNYQYRDAIIQRTVLDFVLKNKKDIKSDVNYEFTNSIMQLLSKYVAGIEDEEEEEEEELPKKKPKKETLIPDDIDEIPDDAIQEIVVKKGLFRKKKRLTADL